MIKGKAMLVIERKPYNTAYGRPLFNIAAHILSCSSADPLTRAGVSEELHCVSYNDGIPDSARKLKPGERIWIKVVYEIHYHQHYDHWSGTPEWSSTIYYNKEKVIRRRCY